MDATELRHFSEELAFDRTALLAVMTGIGKSELVNPTRNADWSVADVLAHVIASDEDLISLLEMARDSSGATVERTSEEHEAEMNRWRQATPEMLVDGVRRRGEAWQALLGGASRAALSTPARVWWLPDARPLRNVLRDWRGHDAQHTADVRLALEASRGVGHDV